MDLFITPKALDRNNAYWHKKIANYNQACHEHEIKAEKLHSLPAKIVLQTTDRCNLTCPICQVPSFEKKPVMPVEIFERVVEQLFPTLIELHPTNVGEPLLGPWFDYMCEQMDKFGVVLDLTTNGTLLDEHKIEKIVPIVRDIKFSFDGATKETFEKNRRGAKFEKVCANIRNLCSALDVNKPAREVIVALQMTLMKSNYLELPRLIELASELGVNRVKAYHLFSFSEEMNQESLMNDLDVWIPVLENALALGEKYNIELQLAEPLGDKEKSLLELTPTTCHLPWHESWIDYDGQVYHCHSHAGKSAGNILREDFFAIWSSELYQSIRRAFAQNKPAGYCRNCGMNYLKSDEHQAVVYDPQSFLYSAGSRQPKDDAIRWSNRMRPFDLSGREK